MNKESSIAITFSDVKPTIVNEAALLREDPFNWAWVYIPALVFLLIAGTVALWYRFQRQKSKLKSNDPINLFHDLCAAHSLTWLQRRTILKLAEIRKTSNPCLIVLDAALWPDIHDPLVCRSLQKKLSGIHRILFQPTQNHPTST